MTPTENLAAVAIGVACAAFAVGILGTVMAIVTLVRGRR